jgi:hypothetical protein
MADGNWNEDLTEIVGVLRWNDLEGGFWSLEFGDDEAPMGGQVVLGQPQLPAGVGDGARVRVRGQVREDVVDFFMAGTRFEPGDVQLLDA